MHQTHTTTYFIDQTSEGQHHMVFNAGFIEILNELFPENEIEYWGIKSSQIAVNELLSSPVKQKLKFHSIPYIVTHHSSKLVKVFFFIIKEFQRFSSFIKIFFSSKKHDVICLSITTFTSFFFFKILSFFFNRHFFVVLHGDIDFIYKASNTYEKANAFVHKIIFKLKNRQLKYIVLNKICKKILIKDKYLRFDEILEINHPYFFTATATANATLNKPIVFAHNGSMEVDRKNSHFIFEVANQLKEAVVSNDITFESIGLATNQIDAYKNQYVKMSIGIKRENLPPYLPREQYEFELNNVHFLLFFFPNDEYVFRASGAVIDAIAFEKPIITLRHPFFENLFLQGGDIGYICDSLDEVIELIKKINSNEEHYSLRYQQQVMNLKKMKDYFNIKNIALDILRQLN